MLEIVLEAGGDFCVLLWSSTGTATAPSAFCISRVGNIAPAQPHPLLSLCQRAEWGGAGALRDQGVKLQLSNPSVLPETSRLEFPPLVSHRDTNMLSKLKSASGFDHI